MTDCDKLIEDILNMAVLCLQTAKTQDGRREIYTLMNYIQNKRSPERIRQMEQDNMARAINGS